MSLPLRRDFIRFQAALDTVAEEWDPLSEDEVAEKTMTPYQLMAEKVIDHIIDSDPTGDIHAKLINDDARHGALVLGRYCNIAALIANREGLDRSQLDEALKNETSFATITTIASVQSSVAVKIENELGLRGYYTETELVALKLHHWALSPDGGITVPNMATIAYESATKTKDLDTTRKHECRALSTRMLDKIFHQFTRICMNDPLLFDRTLSAEHHFPETPAIRS